MLCIDFFFGFDYNMFLLLSKTISLTLPWDLNHSNLLIQVESFFKDIWCLFLAPHLRNQLIFTLPFFNYDFLFFLLNSSTPPHPSIFCHFVNLRFFVFFFFIARKQKTKWRQAEIYITDIVLNFLSEKQYAVCILKIYCTMYLFWLTIRIRSDFMLVLIELRSWPGTLLF